MIRRLFDIQTDNAFEVAAGNAGVNRERFSFWLNALHPALLRIKASPSRQMEAIFSLPARTDDLAEIETLGAHIAGRFKTLVVAGMGGSSLSGETLAILQKPGAIRLRFLDNIDPHSMDQLIEELNWQDTAFLVISKSGNTVETLAHMTILLRQAKERLPCYAEHFFIMTIPDGNPLHALARTHQMRLIAHDTHLGGRFSILSAVGLIPAAAIGLDIRAIRAGAQAVLSEQWDKQTDAPAAQNAALHRALIEKNIRMNVTMSYCDRLSSLATWYRQCWAESLGKNSKATTAVRSRGATDQHSQLQLYLDGPRDKFFTLLMMDHAGQGEKIEDPGRTDTRLNFLKDRRLGDLMMAEQQATADTLAARGCPLRCFMLKKLDEEVLGGLLMHLMMEVIFTAELLNVNAFDQPAVEEGKRLALHYLAGESHEDAALQLTA